MNGNTGWRTLAEPTYGVTESGSAMQLEAGTLLQPYNAKGVDPETGCGVKRGPEGTSTFLFKDAEGWDEPDLAYLTASALRFACPGCGHPEHATSECRRSGANGRRCGREASGPNLTLVAAGPADGAFSCGLGSMQAVL